MFIIRFIIRRYIFLALTSLLSAMFGFGQHAYASNAVDVLARTFYEIAVTGQKTGAKEGRRGQLSDAEALALYSPAQQKHSFNACADQFPKSRPLKTDTLTAIDRRPIALCSNHFAVVYSAKSKTPLVVVERLNRHRISDAKGEQRTNQFYPDPRLPENARAYLSDFKGSGMDRGHNSPAANQPDPVSMSQSFALSNMVAQDPTHNQKIWNKIEQDVRKFAGRADGDVYVYTGPLFKGSIKTIGHNRVWVPTVSLPYAVHHSRVKESQSPRQWYSRMLRTFQISPPRL